MAEHANQVPEKYGEAVQVFHPRINAYHRRLLAAAGPLIVAVAIVAFMVYRRLALPFMVVLIIIALGAAWTAYTMLRPSIVVLTKTYLLTGRTVGWKAIELTDIDHTIFVERLTPKKALTAQQGGLNSLRFKGVPGMWALNSKGKKLLRLDGRIWDAKNLRAIAGKLSQQTTVYTKINVTQMGKQHPGLVTFSELHPGWRSAALAIVCAVLIVILALGATLPEEVLQNWHLM